jgi:DNA helicase HerA-like ATPase
VASQGACEVLVLCEEAHRYVPSDPALGFAPTRQAIARIAKEGRKYGCYLGVVTQRPGELDATILSQCSTIFAMRLSNERDQQIIRSAIADASASTINFLSSIGNREAIAFGEGVATTMRLRFADLAPHELPAMAGGHAPTGHERGDPSLDEMVRRMRGA